MDHQTVVMYGTIELLRICCTKSGRKLAHANLHDKSGYINLIIFPDVYEKYEEFIAKKGEISVKGRLDVTETKSYLIADSFELSVNWADNKS